MPIQTAPSKRLIDLITGLTISSGLPGWCETAKALHLAELILTERPHHVVELGVFGGRSFVPMVLTLEELGHASFAVGIDTWDNAAAIEGMDPHDSDDVANIKYWSTVPMTAVHQRCSSILSELKLWHRCALVQARAELFSAYFAPGSIDFCHIDGNHHLAIRDVELWMPLCRSGAIIVFDDSNWQQTQQALTMMDAQCELVQDCRTYRVYRKKAH